MLKVIIVVILEEEGRVASRERNKISGMWTVFSIS